MKISHEDNTEILKYLAKWLSLVTVTKEGIKQSEFKLLHDEYAKGFSRLALEEQGELCSLISGDNPKPVKYIKDHEVVRGDSLCATYEKNRHKLELIKRGDK